MLSWDYVEIISGPQYSYVTGYHDDSQVLSVIRQIKALTSQHRFVCIVSLHDKKSYDEISMGLSIPYALKEIVEGS